MDPHDQPLVHRLIGLHSAWHYRSAVAVAGLVTLLPLLAKLLPGLQGVWRLALAPSLIVYILLIHPLMWQRRCAAIDALRPLARRPDIVDQGLRIHRLGEALAGAAGLAPALWISHASQVTPRWLWAYLLLTTATMFCLTALSISGGMRRSAHLRRVVAGGLTVDLFDRQALAPVARFGQAVSLTFLGGVCLSLVFQSYETLYSVQSLVIYAILISVSLILFLLPIWSVHSALLAAYERQLLDASTWPFNPKIVKELAASAAAPVLIYGVKVALGLAGGG